MEKGARLLLPRKALASAATLILVVVVTQDLTATAFLLPRTKHRTVAGVPTIGRRNTGLVGSSHYPGNLFVTQFFSTKPVMAKMTEREDDEALPSGSANTPDWQQERLLKDRVCLVTGASRGIGRGIAVELGRLGATVYITGTTTTTRIESSGAATEKADPETIEATARLVTEAGGVGIPVVCDHSNDGDAARLVARIDSEQGGRLDLLVNNAFRIPPGGARSLQGKFWEQGAEVWDSLHQVGLRSHYVTSCLAMPLLLKSRDALRAPEFAAVGGGGAGMVRPLIVMISSFGGVSYTFNVAYGVGKAGVDRLAKDMAVELTPENIAVVSLWPGVVLTERTERAVQSGEWDTYVGLPLDQAETPAFTGRAVVALALDPDNLRKTQSGPHVVAELAEEYGFTDINGRTPPSIRSLRFLLPSYAFTDEWRQKIPPHLIPNWKLPFWVMAQGAPPQQQ